MWMENKAPDWSKIEVPSAKKEEPPTDPTSTGVIFKE
jgi:hypothetical protein